MSTNLHHAKTVAPGIRRLRPPAAALGNTPERSDWTLYGFAPTGFAVLNLTQEEAAHQ